MTLFSLWHDRVSQTRGANAAIAEDQVVVFNDVLETLEREFGTWRVPWGEITRLQRLDESKNEKFQDERPSIPVPGANGNDGAVFTIYVRPEEGQKRRYSVAGSSYVSVVEFSVYRYALFQSTPLAQVVILKIVTTLIKLPSTHAANSNLPG